MAVSLDLLPALPSTLALELEERRARLPHEVRRPGVAHEVRGERLEAGAASQTLEELREAVLGEWLTGAGCEERCNFSDEAHANVAGVTRAFRPLTGKQIVRVGPSFNDPWMLMFASGDTIGESLGQLDTLYGLKRRPEVDAINERFGEALKEHRSAMPAPDVPLALSEPAGPKAERSGDAESRERPA